MEEGRRKDEWMKVKMEEGRKKAKIHRWMEWKTDRKVERSLKGVITE